MNDTQLLANMVVVVPLFDVAHFMGKDWTMSTADHDTRTDLLNRVDFSRSAAISLIDHEEWEPGSGEKLLERIKAVRGLRYGANVFLGLKMNESSERENSVVEVLYRTKGIRRHNFFGDVLVDPYGNRYALYLRRNDEECWHWDYSPLGVLKKKPKQPV